MRRFIMTGQRRRKCNIIQYSLRLSKRYCSHMKLRSSIDYLMNQYSPHDNWLCEFKMNDSWSCSSVILCATLNWLTYVMLAEVLLFSYEAWSFYEDRKRINR